VSPSRTSPQLKATRRKLTSVDGPELVVGLVGATGTDLDLVANTLETALGAFDYGCEHIRLSNLLKILDPNLPDRETTPLDRYVMAYQDAGDTFRKRMDRGDALAVSAIARIQEIRASRAGDPNAPLSRTAYVLRSFKTVDEVNTLRRIYGARLILISAYSPRDARVNDLERHIAESDPARRIDDFRSQAELVISRDEAEEHRAYGQNVRKTFPLADFFVDAREPRRLAESVGRALDLFFGHPFRTPTRDESAMFHAEAAAVRSAELGRQVGAVIATTEGDIVAVGTNDVPKAGGGLYWEGDSGDARDFQLGEDTNEVRKRLALEEVLVRLRNGSWLSRERRNVKVDDLVALLQGTRIDNIIEFGRAVHAEMAALTDAAVRGVSVTGCTVYSTTFPCHLCTRHIIAAGIKRVVYIHPYPKSLAAQLHQDSIAIDLAQPARNLVRFEPFVGLAPRRFLNLFTAGIRKVPGGRAVKIRRPEAVPKLVPPEPPGVAPVYPARELAELRAFNSLLRERGYKTRVASRRRPTKRSTTGRERR
jgi:deoxycytidylate deaminase